MSKVLVISSSPRRKGNSDRLCDEFVSGAQSAGHEVEKIFLRDMTINYCVGCDTCSTKQVPCVQRDDFHSVAAKMLDADVIVFGGPVYFYSIPAQLKTLIDRLCGEYTKMGGKRFYCIASAAETAAGTADTFVRGLQGFLDCLPDYELCGTCFGGGVWHKGEIEGCAALKDAFLLGKGVA